MAGKRSNRINVNLSIFIRDPFSATFLTKLWDVIMLVEIWKTESGEDYEQINGLYPFCSIALLVRNG
jgi:hypothetical protein